MSTQYLWSLPVILVFSPVLADVYRLETLCFTPASSNMIARITLVAVAVALLGLVQDYGPGPSSPADVRVAGRHRGGEPAVCVDADCTSLRMTVHVRTNGCRPAVRPAAPSELCLPACAVRATPGRVLMR